MNSNVDDFVAGAAQCYRPYVGMNEMPIEQIEMLQTMMDDEYQAYWQKAGLTEDEACGALWDQVVIAGSHLPPRPYDYHV